MTETDLHAYVDALSTESRRVEVESHLANHPQDAARVRDYQTQTRALRQFFDPVLNEPLPESLRQMASRPVGSVVESLSRWSLQRIAASVLLVAVGAALGWATRGQFAPDESLAQAVPLARQAAIAHVVYSPDVRRPVEVSAEQEGQLVTWLTKRIGTPVKPPKLGATGFDLIGGRLLPGTRGPVAQFMYQDAGGQRLTLMVSTEIAANQDTAFRFSQEGPVNVFYWIDGSFGYALSASIQKTELARVAKVVYDQLDR